jgi:hypothetical protein
LGEGRGERAEGRRKKDIIEILTYFKLHSIKHLSQIKALMCVANKKFSLIRSKI